MRQNKFKKGDIINNLIILDKDKIVTTNGKIELIKDGNIIKTYEEGIFLGVGAGDITYQLRY